MASRQQQRNWQGSAGFTLVELFVVIALIGIMAALAGPAMKDMVGNYRLSAATRETVSYLKVARMLAVSRHSQTRVRFTQMDAPPDMSTSVGIGQFRVEWKTASPNGTDPQTPVLGVVPTQWFLVGRDLSLPAVSDVDCDASQHGEYCVDFADRFPGISLVWVDPVPNPGGPPDDAGAGALKPAIKFGPDGFVLNSPSDFQFGVNRQEIKLVLVNKRTGDLMNGKVIGVDRAGNVHTSNYIGDGEISADGPE